MPTSTAGKPPGSQRGFSYAMVLAAVVIVGIVAEAAHVTTWRLLKAEREQELLFRGQAYISAIKSYYESGAEAGAQKTYPRSLDDLLKDSRFPGRRHIRALYPDPVGEGERKDWLLIRAADGGIGGVASTSRKESLKKANFPKELEKFAGTQTYAEWVFEYKPPALLPPNPKGPIQQPLLPGSTHP